MWRIIICFRFISGDRNTAVTPLLLRRTSIQKLRHCCQTLNLFPIMFYSFEQRTGQAMSMEKVNLAILMSRITERIYRVYLSLIFAIIRGLGVESMKSSIIVASSEKIVKPATVAPMASTNGAELKKVSRRNEMKFEKFVVQKPKSSPLFFKLTVYLAPLFLALQLIGLFGLMTLSKFSPGFIFLVSSLIFLGCISIKILNHKARAVEIFKHNKRKSD